MSGKLALFHFRVKTDKSSRQLDEFHRSRCSLQFSTGDIEEALKVLNDTTKNRSPSRKAAARESHLTETDIHDATDIQMSNVDASQDEIPSEDTVSPSFEYCLSGQCFGLFSQVAHTLGVFG